MTTQPSERPMPIHPEPIRPQDLAEKKQRGEKIVMVTAYDAPERAPGRRGGHRHRLRWRLSREQRARLRRDHPDQHGRDGHARACGSPGHEAGLFLVDMPLGSFQISDEDAVRNAVRLVKEAGADGVKLEGGGSSVARARAIVAAGIPVMGHIGLTPQSSTMLGGYKAQGRTAAKARQLFADAQGLQAAGCFAIVLEAVPARVSARISEALRIPTIGIGAGPACDGQVLVWHDLLGINEGPMPRFVKQYAHVADTIRKALETYAADVRNGTFPSDEHGYKIPAEELKLLRVRARIRRDSRRSGRRLALGPHLKASASPQQRRDRGRLATLGQAIQAKDGLDRPQQRVVIGRSGDAGAG